MPNSPNGKSVFGVAFNKSDMLFEIHDAFGSRGNVWGLFGDQCMLYETG